MSSYCGVSKVVPQLARVSIRVELRSNLRGARCDIAIRKESKRAVSVGGGVAVSFLTLLIRRGDL